MKKIKYIVFAIIVLLFGSRVYANDIKKISMDIYVDNNGDAHITEIWNASLSNGTEGYKPYYNLGNSSIKDYTVSMNGMPFTTLNNWDVNSSFDNKAYKAGINPIDDGYELCFGISEYGDNAYTMKYTITNFVSSTKDGDMIFWTLIPHELSDKPDYVYIKIYSDFEYDINTPVWGYGNYGGLAYVYDGYIEMIHEDALNSDEYMTIQVKFPKGTFNTSNVLDNDFDYYHDMAENGAISYSDKTTFWDILRGILSFIVGFVPWLAIFVISIISASKYSEYGTKKLKFSKGYKNFKDAPYFREIPLNKDIFAAYWYACQYGLVKNKTDFLGAILLKWLKNGNVENVTVTSKVLKKEERAIKLVNPIGLKGLEIELFNMMQVASIDGVLESNEFTKWCKNHYNKILKWFNRVIDEETSKFVNKGLITVEKKMFGTVHVVSDSLKEEASKLAGLKKFLNDFSNIKDRESIEVKLWEEYLMYAQIFGIAKKVAKEFKKLYPDVITDETFDDIMFIHTISYQGVSAASTARSRAESYSSGGGGFSSGGGGGGSFGGGGGGGGFR